MFFGTGCLVGLMAFSRLLTWLLGRFHGQSYSVIGGLLLGSLPAIWPWKVSEAAVSAEDAEATMRLVLPADYTARLGVEANVSGALLFVVLGLVIVLGLNRLFISLNSAGAHNVSQKN
jgi:putative membrane protein